MTLLLTPSTRHFHSQALCIERDYYPDGEMYLKIPPIPSESDIPLKLVHSLCSPIHDNLIFLKLALDHFTKSGHKIQLFITYLAYARQPLSIIESIVALIESPCLEKIELLEPHQSDIAPLFKIPTENVSNVPLFSDYIQQHYSSPVLVALDRGGKNRVEQLANHLQSPYICLLKSRDAQRSVSYSPLTREDCENIHHKDLILVDDMIDSGGTILKALDLLLPYSPRSINALAAHGVLSQGAGEHLQNSPLASIIITNSIFHPTLPSKFKIINIFDKINRLLCR